MDTNFVINKYDTGALTIGFAMALNTSRIRIIIKKKLGTKRNTTLITHCATGPVSCGCIYQYFGAKHADCKNDGLT